MSNEQIEIYLSAALDQEACKATLTTALVSRVAALHEGGTAVTTRVECLENLCDDPAQLNGDVIESVMDWMLVEMVGGTA